MQERERVTFNCHPEVQIQPCQRIKRSEDQKRKNQQSMEALDQQLFLTEQHKPYLT